MLFLQKSKTMTNGVVNQSLAALRKEPFERSEMVSQLLFGEAFTILERFKGWIRISTLPDGYEGWIDEKLCVLLEKEQECLFNPTVHTVSNQLFLAKSDAEEFPLRLCPGSSLFYYDSISGSFSIGESNYISLNQPVEQLDGSPRELLVKLAQNYINSPYLWGGRSPYGIDCSGLVQILFKQIGINIPRDAGQQVNFGETVDFINMAKPGDVAFFDDEEGSIVHVGIIYPQGKIIHASGYVRVDFIDHQGIFSQNKQKYTHKLRVVKNLIDGLT